MTVQLIKKEFSSSSAETINGSLEMEVGVTLDNALNTGAANVTFLDSYYACHDKGDVMAGVVFSDSGSHDMRCKEFFDARSFYGASAFTVTGAYAGSYGEPISGNSSNNFVNRINRWLEDRQLGTSSNLTIKKLHFAIDASGQKRALIVYDSNTKTTTRYYAKIYSQYSTRVARPDNHSPAAFDQDIQIIEHNAILNAEQYCAAAVDPNGDRHILTIYSVNAV